MLRKLILASICASVLLLLAVASPIFGQAGPAPAPTPAPEDYQAMVKRIKGGDLKIDFVAFRQAYTQSAGFSGYGEGSKKEMYAALNAKKFDDALKLANTRLDEDYVDLNAHFVALVANRELGHADKAEFHRTVFVALMDSIIKGHDGQTAATAYQVISVAEEYAVINYLEFRPSGQGLVREDGHNFDVMTVIDPKTTETHKLYFNIDRFFGKF
jgi:hypothetical protein